MPEAPARRLARRVAALRADGAGSAVALPSVEKLSGLDEGERKRVLEELRVELYALTSVLADRVVARAWQDRSSYPPYGLARSRFSEWRMLVTNPDPYEAGSIGSFFELWKAYVDTVVLHLHREMHELRHHGDDAWLPQRLDALLALFRTDVDDTHRERMKDPFSFLYGGLQFGTSVCVQLAEVMARLLAGETGETATTAEEKAAILSRSSGPAYRLAAMSLDRALPAYAGLLVRPGTQRREGDTAPGWMDPGQFAVQASDKGGRHITLRHRERFGSEAGAQEGAGAQATLGCPARIAPTEGQSSIATLWRWCVDVAHAAGLLAEPVR